jgi:hypothetical protein
VLALLLRMSREERAAPEPFARMKQAVIALFAQMELRGELDLVRRAAVTSPGPCRPVRYPGGGRTCCRRRIDIPVYLGKLWAVWQ